MAHIAIFVGGMAAGDGTLHITGEARVDDGTAIYWNTDVAYNALPSVINAAIVAAAVAAADVESYTIGALDTKTLFAGAMVL